MLSSPDASALDEPTNHLDAEFGGLAEKIIFKDIKGSVGRHNA